MIDVICDSDGGQLAVTKIEVRERGTVDYSTIKDAASFKEFLIDAKYPSIEILLSARSCEECLDDARADGRLERP